ncbi:YncE family protein [Caballeronia sp. RCC_10]|uniref:YncE family protein n=1 Tax=Caballeronia sp. RCC_10 TaxID=3239227 RepID=UPI0035245805
MLVVPQLSRVYASATGANEVVAISEATLILTARTPGGFSPGDMPYAPDAGTLYASNEARGTGTITPRKIRIK